MKLTNGSADFLRSRPSSLEAAASAIRRAGNRGYSTGRFFCLYRIAQRAVTRPSVASAETFLPRTEREGETEVQGTAQTGCCRASLPPQDSTRPLTSKA